VAIHSRGVVGVDLTPAVVVHSQSRAARDVHEPAALG